MPSILIIDDEQLMISAITDALLHLHVRIAAANNGAEGLACLKAELPTLVLLDMSMPVMGGRETLRAIRATPAWRDLPVVIMTAGADAEPGATGLLRKPFGFDELLAAVGPYVGAATPQS